METIIALICLIAFLGWIYDTLKPSHTKADDLRIEDNDEYKLILVPDNVLNPNTIEGAKAEARRQSIISHNEFVAMMESHGIEYQKAKEAFGNIRGFLRPAGPANYRTWLEGYVAKGGKISHYYDYGMPDNWYVAINDFSIVPLYGALSISIIIPKGINVDISAGLGHNSLYYMDDYNHGGFFVPIFNNI